MKTFTKVVYLYVKKDYEKSDNVLRMPKMITSVKKTKDKEEKIRMSM